MNPLNLPIVSLGLATLFLLTSSRATAAASSAAPASVSFVPSAEQLDCYEFIEITVNVDQPEVANPFTEASVEGHYSPAGGPSMKVDGFCDSKDGRVYRIRFMPTQPGEHDYSVVYRQGAYEASHQGKFTARDAGRRGLIRVDREHPWHFLWEGTGEHYFWNGTTTYWLLGWDDETIRSNIDRLAGLKVNRLRTAINGRVRDGRAWYEHVYPTEKFSFLMNPWVAERPDSVEQPGFDVTRFNLPHWHKIERMLRHARERDMVISIIFYVDGARPGVDPFGRAGMGGEAEQRYYRYAVARLASFSNVMWDVTNEYHLFRDEAWTERMGAFIRECDPYDHAMSVHGHGQFPYRTSAWADFAMYQSWDEQGGHRFMLNHRLQQQKSGRPMPQVNEEYGYEDHYPAGWGGGRKAPARSADTRRRLAWGMYMAGGYQTTGERADTGTGWGPDTGGGWLNGRGDDSMTMLEGYGHIVDFFTALPWWRLEPDHDFFATRELAVVGTELTHVVYTRDREGKAALYVDGKAVSTRDVGGDPSNWDKSFRLALGNELTGDRPWRGELHRVALYARVLDADEVARSARAGPGASPAGTLIHYDFREGAGRLIKDTSGAGAPLNLQVQDPATVEWLEGGGLRIVGSALIASSEPATKLIEAVNRSQALTIEAWIKAANVTQAGPARIVTLSKDMSERNFTLGQKADAYEVRFRTTTTSPNGEPALSSPGGDETIPAVVGLRTPTGDLAVLYFSAGGSAKLKPGSLSASPNARWFNPRTGKYSNAQADPTSGFVAPDEADWALLIQARDQGVWPGSQWQEATPEEVGMDSALLAKARDYALSGGGSGMITRHGRAVMRWGDPRQTYDLKSSTKAIGVTAVGLALMDGKFRSLHEPASKHHPDFGVPPEDNRGTSWLERITVFHLAAQTAGFDKPGGYTELLFEPGTKWSYSDGGPNWLAECVTLAYGRDLQELMFERVFTPIGIGRKDLRWRANAYRPKEIAGVARREFGSGIFANVDAMARIGCLYLRGGRWNGTQIIPSWFVDEVRTVPQDMRGLPVVKPEDYGNASDHYGLLWWNNADGTLPNVPRDAYWSWGLYDSLVVVIPSLDIVVARAGKSLSSNRDPHYAPIEPFLSPIAMSVKDRGRWSGAPYPPSEVIREIEWAPAESVIRKAEGSDNWPITWADDDHLHTAYGDGWGFEPKLDRKLSLGFSRVTGGPRDFEGVNVRTETGERSGDGRNGPKASGMLCVDGVLYLFARNTGNAQMAWSADHASTWDWSDWKLETSFGAPTFLNFGRDYAGARDSYVYVYSHDDDSAYEAADRMVMARVPKDRIRERDAYEFFHGLDGKGQPLWTRDIRDRGAVFVNPGRCYRSGISYNAGLKRYLWCQILPESTDSRGPRYQGGFGIYEAPDPWGPWRTAFYTETWDMGPGETASLPPKWMSEDGRACHLLFSGDDCFSVRNIILR